MHCITKALFIVLPVSADASAHFNCDHVQTVTGTSVDRTSDKVRTLTCVYNPDFFDWSVDKTGRKIENVIYFCSLGSVLILPRQNALLGKFC